MLEGWKKYWTKTDDDRYIERCIECGNHDKIKKVLSLIHQKLIK